MKKLSLIVFVGCAGCVTEVAEVTGELAGPPPVPVLFSTRDQQAAVHGAGGDALVIGGDNLDVQQTTLVYAPIADTTIIPPHPAYPTSPLGPIIPVVAADDHALQVVLPASIQEGKSYVLWPVNTDAATGLRSWGAPILINDARPMWISPSWVYANVRRPGLGATRTIRVVGRNLEPAGNATTQICYVPFAGTAPSATAPCPAAMLATTTTASTDATRSYQAEFAVPPLTANTSYRLYIRRDGTSWVPLLAQTTYPFVLPMVLSVRPDPVKGPPVRVTSSGTSTQFQSCGDPQHERLCRPNDGIDDSCCILNALEQARTRLGTPVASGAPIDTVDVELDDTYVAGAEGWLVDPPASFVTPPAFVQGTQGASPVPLQGFAIPSGVNVVGTSNGAERGRVTLRANAHQLFGVANGTVISHLALRTHSFGVSSLLATTIGLADSSDAVITDNAFEPIAMLGGVPNRAALHHAIAAVSRVTRLVVTDNVIAADTTGISLGVATDAIIARNTIVPGPTTPAEANSEIAISWAGGDRNVIRDNTIDGSDTTYATVPQEQGFRGGIYAHIGASHDRELVANNGVYCTGFRPADALGHALDGEGISIDENGSIDAYAKYLVEVAPASGGHTITLDATDAPPHPDACPNNLANCPGTIVTIVSGAGRGQARRVASAVRDITTGNVSLVVRPPFDVAPQPQRSAEASAVVVTHSLRHVYVVGNTVDNRSRGARACPTVTRTLDNKSAIGPAHNGGLIVVWGVDWVVANNTLQSAAGISTRAQYVDYCDGANHPKQSFPMTSMWGEIRENRIRDATSSFHMGGIFLRSDLQFDGQRTPGTSSCAPPISHQLPYRMGLGISVARNDIVTPSNTSLDTGNDFKLYPDTADPLPVTSSISIVGYTPGMMAWSPGYSFTTIVRNRIVYSDGQLSNTRRYGILNGDLMSPSGTSAVGLPSPNTNSGSGNHPLHTLVCGNTVTDPGGSVANAPPLSAAFFEPQPAYAQTATPSCPP